MESRLKTRYLGFELDSPVVPSASPLTRELDTAKQLEDAGAPLIVMHSLFEEEIYHEDEELDHHMASGSESYAESLTFFPSHHTFVQGPEGYLKQLRAIKDAVAVPVIGSLNGISLGGWTEKAKLIEEAGADALELNIYYLPTDPKKSSEEIEAMYVDILTRVKKNISIPVAMKLSPYFTGLPAFCTRLADQEVDGLVLFNRFYQPDINLEELEVESKVNLSNPDEIRLPLRWIAVLSGFLKTVSFASSSGAHSAGDVLKLIMAGADITMMTSALLKFGPGHLMKVKKDLIDWMDENEYETISQMKGSMSMETVLDPKAFARSNYIKMLNTYRYDPKTG